MSRPSSEAPYFDDVLLQRSPISLGSTFATFRSKSALQSFVLAFQLCRSSLGSYGAECISVMLRWSHVLLQLSLLNIGSLSLWIPATTISPSLVFVSPKSTPHFFLISCTKLLSASGASAFLFRARSFSKATFVIDKQHHPFRSLVARGLDLSERSPSK